MLAKDLASVIKRLGQQLADERANAQPGATPPGGASPEEVAAIKTEMTAILQEHEKALLAGRKEVVTLREKLKQARLAGRKEVATLQEKLKQVGSEQSAVEQQLETTKASLAKVTDQYVAHAVDRIVRDSTTDATGQPSAAQTVSPPVGLPISVERGAAPHSHSHSAGARVVHPRRVSSFSAVLSARGL